MKTYLLSVRLENGVVMHIGYYADTPCKNYRLYYCGSDCGYRFEYLGNASRALQSMAAAQVKNGITNHQFKYGTKTDVPWR